MRLVLGIENLKHAVRRRTPRKQHLVERVEAVDRLVKQREKQQEFRKVANRQLALHHGRTTKAQHQHIAYHPQKRHARRVQRPPLHHSQRRDPQLVGKLIEPFMLRTLRSVGLDLSHARDVVVQQGIEIRCGISLIAITIPPLCRINPRAHRQQRHWQSRPCRNRRVEDEKKNPDAQNLQRRDQTLFDSIDEHALHVGHILDHPRHDVARAFSIKPNERQFLDLVVKVRADVENDLLFKGVVHENPQRVQSVLKQKPRQRHQRPKQKLMMPRRVRNHLVDHMTCGIREHKYRQGHAHGTKQLHQSHHRIAPEIGKNPQDRFHAARAMPAAEAFVKHRARELREP